LIQFWIARTPDAPGGFHSPHSRARANGSQAAPRDALIVRRERIMTKPGLGDIEAKVLIAGSKF
jgi:hypothetical protein